MLGTARSIAFTVLVLFTVAACGTSPPVRYYALSATSVDARQDPADTAILGLGPLSIPEYLNRSQIVTRDANSEFQVDEFSRWTEPLGQSLHRVVATNVDNLLDNVVVVTFPYDSSIRDEVVYRLVGDVSRFDADRSGRVVLEVQWYVAEVDAEIVVGPRRDRYETQATRSAEPAAAAAAMNEVLLLFSQDISSALAAAM
ncbi:MAG: PqiC family protein [Woeseiaceae bacterium]